jgi:hypothetical protein
MTVTGVRCIQVGLGRKFKKKDGTEVQDMVARCIVDGEEGQLGSNSFFDYKLADDEKNPKTKDNLLGKILTLQVDEIRQPYAGAPVSFSGKVLKAA